MNTTTKPTTPKPRPLPLPPELRALCGRLAVERVRAQQWALAAELRREQLARIAAGENPGRLAEELRQAINVRISAHRGRHFRLIVDGISA